jgi:RND family efflux transporter MFP subunit
VGDFRLLQCALKLEEWWQFCKSVEIGHRVPAGRNLLRRWCCPDHRTENPLKLDLTAFCSELFAAQELIPRARVIARAVAESIAGCSVNIYTAGSLAGEDVWIPRAWSGEQTVRGSSVPVSAGSLAELAAGRETLLFSGSDLSREDYAHLDIRRTLRSLAYLPLLRGSDLVGVVEILCFENELTAEEIAALEAPAKIAASALRAAHRYESERNDSLASVSRLTQLYDLEKSFSSTLEMEELLPIISDKFREVMECSAINLWLLRGDESLELMHQSGLDPTTPAGSVQKPGEGIPGNVSDDGEAVLIVSPDDPRLGARSAASVPEGVSSLIVVAIMDRGALVGVVEAINKLDATPFDDDDVFALSSVTETASTALHNAGLLMAERKVEVLETLVTVSHEITSTLNLERMLQTIVNAPQAVIPYERAAIALEQRGRFKLSAVTGVTQVNADAPDIAPLNGVLQWAALAEEIVNVRQHGEVIDSDREETRAKFKQYFAESGMRGFYALPLNDDTGRVGILSLESSDPDFLSAVHIELLQVLASQATVALRNAQMYKEVPFISILEPVLERKRRFMAMEKRRRTLFFALAAVATLFLIACPLPLRIDGDAMVAPGRRALVQPEVEGVVERVAIHEGQSVQRGQMLAEMQAWSFRSALAEAQSKYQSAVLQMNRALAANDGSAAGVQRVQADYWKSEVDRATQLLEKTRLRSPIDGVVATPHVENFAGRKLQQGDSFAEVVDTSQAIVDVAIDDTDAGLLKAGQKAVVKLNSYPTRTFQGNILIVSPKAELLRDATVFYARVAVPNADGTIRTGMEGRGKIRVGWQPAAYVIFRRPFFWLYSKVWYWLGW